MSTLLPVQITHTVSLYAQRGPSPISPLPGIATVTATFKSTIRPEPKNDAG